MKKCTLARSRLAPVDKAEPWGADMAVESSNETMGSASARHEVLAQDEAELISAMSHAQIGDYAEAAQILHALRAKYADGHSHRISIRLIILEAILWYYRDRHPESFDRARRANILATAFGLKDLEAESAVWIAHFSFNFADYSSLKRSIEFGFVNFGLLTDDIRARLCLVAADSNQFLGSPGDAARWYTLSRVFSRRSGSRAILTAIEYNRVVMALSRLRLERFVSVEITSQLRKSWLAEVASIGNLHQSLGANALRELLLLCESYAYQLEGAFAMAIEPLMQIQLSNSSGVCGMSEEQLALEIEWCRALSDENHELGEVLPTLDELGDWPSGAQILGLRQIEEISKRTGRAIDLERLRYMLKNAIDCCAREDQRLREAIDISNIFLVQIEGFVNLSKAAQASKSS